MGGVSGGAVVPPILGAAADANNSTALAMVVPMMFFVAAWTYALCVNFVPSYRDPADKFTTAKIGIENVGAVGDEESGMGSGGEKHGVLEKEEVGEHVNKSPEVKIG